MKLIKLTTLKNFTNIAKKADNTKRRQNFNEQRLLLL